MVYIEAGSSFLQSLVSVLLHLLQLLVDEVESLPASRCRLPFKVVFLSHLRKNLVCFDFNIQLGRRYVSSLIWEEVGKVNGIRTLAHLTRHRINRLRLVLDSVRNALGILLVDHLVEVLALGLVSGGLHIHDLVILVSVHAFFEDAFDLFFPS